MTEGPFPQHHHHHLPSSSHHSSGDNMMQHTPATSDLHNPHHHHHFSTQHHHHVATADSAAFAKKRPLATLAALRRPPIDPIVLAASLTTGPHVTRHHFHHSYGTEQAAAAALGADDGAGEGGDAIQALTAGRGGAAGAGAAAGGLHGASSQMARSERLRLLKQQKEQGMQPVASTSQPSAPARAAEEEKESPMHRTTPATRSFRAGSYANCDLDDDQIAALPSSSSSRPSSSATNLAKPVRTADPAILDEILNGVMASPGTLSSEKLMQGRTEASLYSSRQMPRSVRIQVEKELAEAKREIVIQEEEEEKRKTIKQTVALPRAVEPAFPDQALTSAQQPLTLAGRSSVKSRPPLSVRCYARTRVPTPHGEVFCHIYKNNHDAKEHLALVVDWEQNDDEAMQRVQHPSPIAGAGAGADLANPPGKLRSRTLEEKWSADETEMERIVRGAYVGRLGPGFQKASVARPRGGASLSFDKATAAARREGEAEADGEDAAPLVRIHSECYTGETIGSQRCDCGEQLDEAIRLISASGPSYFNGKPRGVVVYLRQEGRGIGLLDKIMAYNLQDMGHDTVSANVLLGHLPDARKYDIASAILRDLGVDECRLLTNNPEKMEALEAEGVRVVERVPMVPRMWKRSTRKMEKLNKAARRGKGDRKRRVRERSSGSHLHHSIVSQFDASEGNDSDHHHHHGHSPHEETDSAGDESDSSVDSYVEHALRRSGATMLGGSVTRGPELEKYLRTKVERMGHMLELPPEEQVAGPKTTTTQGKPTDHSAQATAHGQHPKTGVKVLPQFPAGSESHSMPPHLKPPPHLRHASAIGTPLTRTSSAMSVTSQPESVLGEGELKEMMLQQDSASAESLEVVDYASSSSAAAARSSEQLSTAELKNGLEMLLKACQEAKADEGTNPIVDQARLKSYTAEIEACLAGDEGGPTAFKSAGTLAEELMDLSSSAIENADMGQVDHGALSRTAQIMLLAGKVIKISNLAMRA